MKPTATPSPDERDAHLRAALRHAPDAALGAPAHVSAQIIAAAHRAAAEPLAQRAPQAGIGGPLVRPWWQSWCDAKPARWGASGAMASVLMAGLLALLWRGTPPGPARDDVAAVAPAAAPLAASTAAPNPSDSVAAVEAAPATERLRQTLQPAPAPHRALPRPAATVAPALVAAAPALVAAAPPPVPPPAVAAATQSDAAPPPAKPPAQRAAAAPAPSPSTENPETPRLDSDRMSRAAARAAPLAVKATASAEDAPAPSLQAWLRSQAQDPARPLQWQVDGAARVPADTGWLQGLARLADGHWQAAAATPARPEAAAPLQLQLHLFVGVEPVAQLRLGAAQVVWCPAAARCWTATLPAAPAGDLLRTVPR